MKDEYKEKLKESTSSLGTAVKDGLALGAATEGVNYTYKLLSKQLQERFNVSAEILNDPVNREFIMMASVALLHVGSSVFEDHVPNANKIQKGCELVIEGKTKDNFGKIAGAILPMLGIIGNMMDPDAALDRKIKSLSSELDLDPKRVSTDETPVEPKISAVKSDSSEEAETEVDLEDLLLQDNKKKQVKTEE